ncbi:hypothetical protein THIOM_001209 [Candidatus Thiomargarita nelsonii]|uniref:Uncharacterized protein n=1 Tax=Candidatus Thiomargarita nelsonii TaxID=1003181 RepID=A0A176S4X3_9GAMM|nr:hypothetical protein THIOM_001209 [Candidatus Thiomargarita nelsonii]
MTERLPVDILIQGGGINWSSTRIDSRHIHFHPFRKHADGHLFRIGFYQYRFALFTRQEWVWWEIWHHEGRRARHGAAMSGPDYTWWHGMYEVVKHTYFSFIPELKKLVGKKEADRLLTKYFKPIDGHAWYFNGLGKKALDDVRKGYEERYGKGSFK